MPYINLIQEQRLTAQANERKARSFFFTFIGALVASVSTYGYLTMEGVFVSRQAAVVEAQNKLNEPLVKQIDENGKALADLTPKLKTLQDAKDVTDRWNRILNHLAVQTPSDAWLTGLRCAGSDPTKPITISFLGISTAQSTVGEFILRLQNQHDLDNVNLDHTNEKFISDDKAFEFKVDADIVGTAEQKVKTEGDAK